MIKIITVLYMFTPSSECGNCHTDIYREWKNSLHAQSVTDPVFKNAYNKIKDENQKKKCLNCHSPTVLLTKDYKIEEKITKEGVTCDFCHSVKGMKDNSYIIEVGEYKYGPFKPVLKSFELGHKSKYSELHKKSEFCKGCHEYKNRYGIYVLDTYNEWKKSEYSEKGIQCQNCHMPIDPYAKVVNPDIYPSERFVTAHKFLGGRSQIRLKEAAEINLIYEKEGDNLVVSVYVTNKESGHMLPTGIPIKRLTLEVYLTDKQGKIIEKRTKIYQRVVVDINGKVIKDIDRIFTDAYKIVKDNRIPPGETIRESFTFNIKEKGAYTLKAELRYEYRVPIFEPYVRKMVIDKKEVKIHSEKENKRGIIGFVVFSLLLLIAIGVLLTTLVILLRKQD